MSNILSFQLVISIKVTNEAFFIVLDLWWFVSMLFHDLTPEGRSFPSTSIIPQSTHFSSLAELAMIHNFPFMSCTYSLRATLDCELCEHSAVD